MIYENVKTLCASQGISIAKLEQAAGVGNGTIGKWRNSMPSVETLKKVADHLKVTVDELLKEER